MTQSSLKFGTSGLRGLASELAGAEARRYTRAFLDYASARGLLGSGRVFVGRDLRASSAEIAEDCGAAISSAGLVPVACGTVPTPALALHALSNGSAAIMVTGSHIPADRNGLKFYLQSGEIGKADEAGIVAALRPDTPGDDAIWDDQDEVALRRYLQRCQAILALNQLRGLRIGVFQHSSVARDLLVDLLCFYGAETVTLGRSDGFIPIDTEAFGDPALASLSGWVQELHLDALVSTDADGDRPLLMDGGGQFVRGDMLGLLTARYLGAKTVVTPVTSNSGIESCGFRQVIRTKVGSPFVIEPMRNAMGPVVGFEANGGVLVGEGLPVPELATRDALLPLLATLGAAAQADRSVEDLVASLALPIALADRLQDVSREESSQFLQKLSTDECFAERFFEGRAVVSMSLLDGPRFTLAGGELVHVRGSGNAPELRCYVEAKTHRDAEVLLNWAMAAIRGAMRG